MDALDRSNADLLQYVKPGFVKAVDAAKDADRMPPALPAAQQHRLEVEMQFRSIVSLACAVSLFTGSALASAAYARRVDELTMERDIYASREENWMNKAVERKETIEQLQTEVEQLTDTIAADQSIALTYAGSFNAQPTAPRNTRISAGRGRASLPAAPRFSRA